MNKSPTMMCLAIDYIYNQIKIKRQSKRDVFVKQVRFSYGESPRTPPLERTSLHRRNNSVERPWGILSLSATCLLFCVKSYQSRCRMSLDQRPGWKMAQDMSVNKSHSEERKEPYNTLNRTERHRKGTA